MGEEIEKIHGILCK